MHMVSPPTALGERRRALFPIAVFGLLLTLGGCGLAQPVTGNPPAATPEAFAVELWRDRAEPDYAIGESLQLYLRPNRDAQVVVVNVDSRGQTTVLFPNDYASNNRLAADRVVSLPGADTRYALRIDGPPGPSLIRVIATTGTMPLLDSATLTPTAGPFARSQRSADELARQVQVVANQEPGATWVVRDETIQIHAARPVPQPPSAATTPTLPAPAMPGAAGGSAGDGFGLQLRTDRGHYRAGDLVRVGVAAERDCDLTLVGIDSHRQARQLYPNTLVRRVSLKAGEFIWLPEASSPIALRAAHPPGTNTLVALCHRTAASPLPIPDGRAVFPTLADTQLQQALDTGDSNTVARATVQLDILP